MFEIVFVNPEQTADNPFKINFVTGGAPPPSSPNLFVIWFWDDDDYVGVI